MHPISFHAENILKETKKEKMALVSFKTTLIIFMFLLFTSFTSSMASIPSPSPSPSRPFEKIYVFGDSYTDTGNTESSTGPCFFMHVSNPPYGQTFFHRPTNRYSDGRLVIDFVSEALSLPYMPPYRDVAKGAGVDVSHGINFAVAGATAIKHRFFVRNNLTLNITPQSLQTQLNWFNKFLESKGCNNGTSRRECKEVFDDSLFWIGEMGANDYSYTTGSSVPDKTIRDLSIASVTGFLKALLNKGAKYVVVQGLPPTGCLVVFMYLTVDDNDRDEMGCVASLNKRSFQHNQILQTKLKQMNKEFPEAVIVYADYWNSYTSVVKNASNYGIKEKFKACCGSGGGFYNFEIFNTCGGSPSSSIPCKNPAEYINWDGGHLTEAMYKVLTNSFLNGKFTNPPFDYLIKMKHRAG